MWGLPGSFGADPQAGATPYANSVQYVSITIPAGATSAAASISAVGSTAFITFLGFYTITAGNGAIGYARVELTNATTVTAYRNTSDASITVTATACVVDATGRLVKTVQAGTITISGATSNTASIAPVTNANAVIHYLGQTYTETVQIISHVETVVSLSGTVVTAAKQNATGDVTVGYIVIEFQGAALAQAVQPVSQSWTAGTAATAAITSVNTANSLLFYGGSNANISANESTSEQYADLTNGTTVTVHVNTSGSSAKSYNCSVVEFAPGVLAGVQRGTTTLTAISSGASAIAAVNTSRAMLSYLDNTATVSTSAIRDSNCAITLTDATTITLSRGTANGNVTGSWEIAEFN